MIPPWLDVALTDHAYCNLDHADGRHAMAVALNNAIPRNALIEAARAVLLTKAMEPGTPNLDDVARTVALRLITTLFTHGGE